MPKGKRKGKKATTAAVTPVSVGPEEEDNLSITTELSGSTTLQCSEGDEGVTEQENYETKIKEAMDLATEKSAATRINALKSLQTALRKRVVTSFLIERHQTFTDIIEKSMKKGKIEEQIAAVKLSCVYFVTLMETKEGGQVYKTLEPILRVILLDPTVNPLLRTVCAHALALSTFLMCSEPTDISLNLQKLHSIFATSLPKGNGELPTYTPERHALNTAALQGYCLLLTLISPSSVYTLAPKLLTEFLSILESNDVDLRIMVGEAVALVYETARCHMPDFRWQKHKEITLLNSLNDLVTDSHKYRSKKDRKHQRASFREVLRTVKESDTYEEIIVLGPAHHKNELILDSWSLRWRYQALCNALEEGLNMHMILNPMVRDLFDLGPPPLQLTSGLGLVKKTTKKINRETPEVKARSLARSKNRDNRHAALEYYYDD